MGDSTADYLRSVAGRLETTGMQPDRRRSGQLRALAQLVHEAAEAASQGQLTQLHGDELAARAAVLVAVVNSTAGEPDLSLAESRAIDSLQRSLSRHVIIGPPSPGYSAVAHLTAVADAYSSDGTRQRRAAVRLIIAAATFFIVASAVIVLGALVGSDDESSYWRFLIASVPLLLAGAVLVWLAERHRRLATEAVRLQRQLQTLDPYLAAFDEPVRSLLLATLVPRFFGRTLEDLDPLRDPRIPQSTEMLNALGVNINADNSG